MVKADLSLERAFCIQHFRKSTWSEKLSLLKIHLSRRNSQCCPCPCGAGGPGRVGLEKSYINTFLRMSKLWACLQKSNQWISNYRISANSFRSLVRKEFKFSLDKKKIIATTIWNFLHFTDSKKNSLSGSHSRKYYNFCRQK